MLNALRPDGEASIPAAVRIAVTHLGVSRTGKVSAEKFMAALAQAAPAEAADAALGAFLDEAEPADFADLVASRAATFESLAKLSARWLPFSHPNRVLLDELAARTET